MAKHLAEPDEEQPPAPIWRTKVALSAVLMLAVIVMTVFGFRWLTSDQPGTPDTTFAVNNSEAEPSLEDDEAVADTAQEDEDSADQGTSSEQIIVHVAGEVHNPGIAELTGDARVVDAIEAAGGPTDGAHLDALNLAALANDGDYILVPDSAADAAQDDPLPPGGGNEPDGAAGAGNGTVNINTADAAALETLPGIGPATASDIIGHRDQHGDFTDLASLEEVSGIGPATRERLNGLVSW